MERDEVKKFLMIIQTTYPNYRVEDKAAAVQIWEEMLQDYSYKECAYSLKKYLATDESGFPPGIGAIIQGIPKQKTEILNEMEAWALVGKALRNGTYGAEKEFAKLPELVQKAVGSPDNIRNWAQTDSLSIENVVQSNFIKTYRTLMLRKEKEDAIPISMRIAEREILGIEGK